MNIIEARDLCFSYRKRPVLNNFSMNVEEGSFVFVYGPNGSGKSTLVKLLNRLEVPDGGTLKVAGFDCSEEKNIYDVRTSLGVVFQNPDNQIIGDTVEDDIAFGPENLGLESSEIQKRVYESMKLLGIEEFADDSPCRLSGGQKQKVAIAGVLAMGCRCIVLDESLSMLDVQSKSEVLEVLHRLNKTKGTTVVVMTNRKDELEDCDDVITLLPCSTEECQ